MTDSNSSARPPKPRKLFRWGALGTLVYLLCIGLYVTSRWSAFEALAPNELGDFAAGAFSPLAFFWLVLGFIQQGEELRNSGKALWLQGEELRNSVEQQKQLVEVTRDQLLHEKQVRENEEANRILSSEPILRLQNSGSTKSGDEYEFRFRLVNSGNRCTDVKFVLSASLATQSLDWIPALDNGGSHNFTISFRGQTFKLDELFLIVSYANGLGMRRAVHFQFEISPEPLKLSAIQFPVNQQLEN